MFTTILRPYQNAGYTLIQFVISVYTFAVPAYASTHAALTSQQAKDIYKTVWILAQVAFWFYVLVAISTFQAGRQFRAYYEAEWAADVARLIDWVVSYPDRYIAPEITLIQTDETATAPDGDDVPQAVQAILASDAKPTLKHRNVASHYGIRWRNARGEGKHMVNADIRNELSPYPTVLAALNAL